MARQDTSLESEGAEFLVLGNLLIEGISAYKTYTNQQGYDLLATDPTSGRIAKIQVKSRWGTNAGSCLIRNFDFDFVALARLNRGFVGRKKELLGGKRAPEFFILPVAEAKKRTPNDGWGKLRIKKGELEEFQDRWDLISQFLKRKQRTSKNTAAKLPSPKES